MKRAEQTVHLCVGELVLSKEPIVVSTTLGSCVSVCLFTKNGSAGGMAHYALPSPTHQISADEGFRYARIAIPRLIEELSAISGMDPADFSAKIVGGARVDNDGTSQIQAGPQNISIARSILAEYGIKIVGESVGGDGGRTALFHIPSGRLQVAKLSAKERHATATKGPGVRRSSNSAAVGSPAISAVASSSSTSAKETLRSRPAGKRKVLIVDDSKTIRELLNRILRADPDLEVVGTASDAFEADKLVHVLKPDVITLDIHMPGMTGVQWLEKTLPKLRIPVVMISSLQLQEGNEVFRALELGAVDYIQKPSFSDLSLVAPIICEKIKEASFAKVVLHHQAPIQSFSKGTIDTSRILAIGASTGGTEALKSVLCSLPEVVPPIVIVQHIPPVFSRAFADRMNQLCKFEVKEAEDGDELETSRVLIAPGGKQMKVEQFTRGYRVRITDDAPVNRHKPSVDYLFHSVASVIGKKSIGVILTGMGNDGAAGLLAMRKQGSRTIGQDEESSVVYGMPRVAFEVGAVETVAALSEIPKIILNLLTGQRAA